tara:strand:+ start:2294 stop:2686 length:393 start_codon:yes stop_codon:yes gene_type:complete
MKKELTEKQQDFLQNLISSNGDPREAARRAGYAEHYQVTKALKAEILDLAESILAQSAPQAAMKMVSIMNSDEPIPQANMRLQAAQSILDRIGLSKTDRIDVTHKTEQGLFILPAKKETIINGEYEEAQG